jgi:hypothetical protein
VAVWRQQVFSLFVQEICWSSCYKEFVLRWSLLYVDPNSIRRLTTERSEAHRRYGSLLPSIYTPCKPPARVRSHHKITHGVCKHTPDIVKFCWLAPVVFTSRCWRGFSTLKSCVSVLWFPFRSSLLPIAFVTWALEGRNGMRRPLYLRMCGLWKLTRPRTSRPHGHMVQFEELWTQPQDVHLIDDIEDDITWSLSASGQ